MEGVLLGFGVVLFIVLTGFIAASLIPHRATAMQSGMTPAVYYIANPALMFVLLAETNLGAVLSVYTPIALITAAFAGGIYALISRFLLKRSGRQVAVGAMASSYVNAGNIGLPIALYAVGSAAPVVAVLIAQLLVVAPLYLAVFSFLTARGTRDSSAPDSKGSSVSTTTTPLWRTLLGSVANPVTVATAFGAVFAFFGWRLPEVIWTPLEMLGNASVVMLLLIFGMSLRGQSPFKDRSLRPDLVTGGIIKLAVMPVAAWALGSFVFGLRGTELLGVVVMAALPTAQNVYLFATQFKMPALLARDIIFVSSLLAFPVILGIAFLLGI